MSVFDKPRPRLSKHADGIAAAAYMTAALDPNREEMPGMPSKEEMLIAQGLGLRSAWELPKWQDLHRPAPPPVAPRKTLLGGL